MTTDRADAAEPEPSSRSCAASADGVDDLSIILADSVVQGLFAVGLALTTTSGMVGGPAKARLEEAIELVDQLLRDVRAAAFEHVRCAPTSDASEDAERSLRDTAQHLNGLATIELPDEADAFHLLDAAHSAHRAVIALEDARLLTHTPALPGRGRN